MDTFKDVGVPIIAAIIGAVAGSGVTFFWPKVWRVFGGERYVDPKSALRQSLLALGRGVVPRPRCKARRVPF